MRSRMTRYKELSDLWAAIVLLAMFAAFVKGLYWTGVLQ